MTLINPTVLKLRELIEPVCAGAGFECVDVHYLRETHGWVVRIYMEGAGVDKAVSFQDCERVSREVSAVLDVEDPIPHEYTLEVSSPGVDRPLRTVAHFERFVGETARVCLRTGVQGRRNFEGILVGVQPSSVEASEDSEAQVTIEVDGVCYALPMGDVRSAKLVPNWEQLTAKR